MYSQSSFIKGMVAGVVVGTAVAMVANPLDQRKMNVIKKRMGRAVKAVGYAVNNISHMR